MDFRASKPQFRLITVAIDTLSNVLGGRNERQIA